jgi:NTE family protein
MGLALGGGGALGGVHIGVLKVLQEQRIRISAVAGTSAGAVIGALYATTLDARETERRILDYLESENISRTLFCSVAPLSSSPDAGFLDRFSSFLKRELLLTLTLSQPALISKQRFRENLSKLIDDIEIRDTAIPFAAIATDLEKGSEVALSEGSLVDAVYASCSYPGLVEAVPLEGRLLVDGGTTSVIPVAAARRLGADVVVAVSAQPDIKTDIPPEPTAMDVIYRAEDILVNELAACKGKEADVLIKPSPCSVTQSSWHDLRKLPSYIPDGEKATRPYIGEIRRLVEDG